MKEDVCGLFHAKLFEGKYMYQYFGVMESIQNCNMF